MQATFADELILKEVEIVELRFKCEVLEKEVDKYKGICAGLKEDVVRMREAHTIVCGKEQSAQEGFAMLLKEQNEEHDVRAWCTQLLADNRVLESAKQSALNEIGQWQRKCADLEARRIDMEHLERKCGELELLVLELTEENARLSTREQEMRKKMEEEKKDRQFQQESNILGVNSSRNFCEHGDFINLSYDEDQLHVGCFDLNIDVSEEMSSGKKTKDVIQDGVGSSQMKRFLLTPTCKRKCFSRIITSDSDDEDIDDRIPIGRLKRSRIAEVNEDDDDDLDDSTPIGKLKHSGGLSNDFSADGDCLRADATQCRRRLFTLRECGKAKGRVQGTSLGASINQEEVPTDTIEEFSRNRLNVARRLRYFAEDDGGDEEDDSGADGKDESLDGFIVNDHEVEESASSSSNTSSCSSDESISELDLRKVLAKIQREKNTEEWEYEADMLAAFSKDPNLCMKAVCAIYRQQTSEERFVMGTIDYNRRGFCTFDAFRGSRMAEFLLDDDTYGPVKKSVEELLEFEPSGVDYCLQLATRYSKQLFNIYTNKEDPFFGPS